MRKLILLVACFLIASVYAYADMTQNGRSPREWPPAVSGVKLQSSGTDYTDNTTVFTNLAVTGNNATGNPGYIAFMAAGTDGVARTYYLWVDPGQGNNGVLRFASFGVLTSTPTIAASFPYGDWRYSTGFTSGVAVSTVQCNSAANPTLC